MTERKNFALVIFSDDNAVAAVPSSWISADENFCAWPEKHPKNFETLNQTAGSQPGTDWKWLKVVVKKYYGKCCFDLNILRLYDRK